MDLGEWIGLILMIGISIVSAISEKKKEKEKRESQRPDTGAEGSAMGPLPSRPVRRRHVAEDEDESLVHAPAPMRVAAIRRKRREAEQLRQLTEAEQRQPETQSWQQPGTTPTPPSLPPQVAEEGARVTSDPVPPMPAPAAPGRRSSAGLDLHDKDALRHAIILSDILPPKF